VRRWVKVIVWTGVFTACAGAGAYVAAHTNPFPPGVEDPGARPTTPPPTSPAPSEQRWTLVMLNATRHELHVGGACRSTWRTTGSVTIRRDGSAGGRAKARLRRWGCDFPVAQVQTRTVDLRIRGSLQGHLVLRFSEAGSSPPGSQDLGGFVATIPLLRPSIGFVGGHGSAVASASRLDGDLGRYVNGGELQLDCGSGC
jgi:hypothetical protein